MCPVVDCKIKLDESILQPLNTPSFETLKRYSRTTKFFLQYIILFIKFPSLKLHCKYYENGEGCKKTIVLEKIEIHENSCPYASKFCKKKIIK
jgi:hypothetical protein